MAKMFVICGHGAGDPGACANGFQEAAQVRKLAQRIQVIGGSEVIIGDMSRNWYQDKGIALGHCPKGVPVLELHMDSAAAAARGGHVIIKDGFSADAIDKALADFIGGFFPGRSKTIVGRSDLANVNRAARAGVNYRLMECGFISNAADANKFETHMDELARGILASFEIGASTPAPQPAPKPQWGCRDLGDTDWTGPAMVSEWQAQLGTPVDGCISGQSKYNSKTVQWAITVSPACNPARGSSMVIALQKRLIALGFSVGPDGADGHMGKGTVKALQAFLNDRLGAGLVVDGLYGHATSRAVGVALQRGLFS